MDTPSDLCLLTDADDESATSVDYRQDGLVRDDLTPGTLIVQYTYAGRGLFEFGPDRKRYNVPTGHAFMVIHPGPYRYWFPPRAKAWKFLWANVLLGDQYERVKALLSEIGPVNRIPPDSTFAEFLRHCAHLGIFYGGVPNPYERSRLGYHLITELFSCFCYEGERQVHPPALMRAVHYIGQHLGERITLQRVCKHAGVSNTTLNSMFKKYLGTTAIQFLISRRIDRAKRRMVTSDLPLKAIAEELGFVDANHFSKTFRQHVGTTPNGFRSKVRSAVW